MQDNDLRYFQVANQFNRDVVVSFNDRSLEDGVEKMRKFLSKNTGFHRIKLYSNNDLKTNGVPRQEPQVFEVSITGKEFDPPKEDSAPITGRKRYTQGKNQRPGAGATIYARSAQ
jgi:hypothetical protein